MASSSDTYLEYSPYLDLLTGVSTALSINEGIIKVVGAQGSGKTAFCHKLEAELAKQKYDVIYFEAPPESPDYLHERIQNYLCLDKHKNFNKCLTEYLLAKSPPNHKLIVIYDNAELIDKQIFILIRLLNNIHSDSETLVSQIICGTEKLDERFDDHDLRSLTQYLNQSFTLPPMDRNQIEDFCYGYAREAGVTRKKFSSKEFTDIFMSGKGLPGKTIALLDKAFAVDRPEQKEKPIAAKVPAGILAATEPVLAQDNEAGSANEVVPDLPVEAEIEAPALTDTAPDENTDLNQETAPALDTDPGQQDIEPEDTASDAIPTLEPMAEASETENQDAGSSEEEITQIDALADLKPEPLPETESLEVYAREVDEILEEGPDARPVITPVYFKAVLSIIVVVVTMVLAVILSGENETVNNRIAEILEIDTPLYMDEITSTADITPASETETVPETGNQAPLPVDDATGDILPVEVAQDNNQNINEFVTESLNENTEVLAEAISETPAAIQEAVPVVNVQTNSDVGNAEELPAPDINNVDVGITESEVLDLTIVTDQANTGDDTNNTLEEDVIEIEPESSNGNVNETTNDNLVSESSESIINAAITSWLIDWQAGNADGYLASYHTDFVPAYHASNQEWRSERLTRIDGVQGITTSFDRLEILQESEEEIRVRFWLYYSRNNYSDETLKEMRFSLDGNTWKILTERNIQVNVN